MPFGQHLDLGAPRGSWRSALIGGVAALTLMLASCAIRPILEPANNRSFDFGKDTFAYANELEWDYRTDFATGATSTTLRGAFSSGVPDVHAPTTMAAAKTSVPLKVMNMTSADSSRFPPEAPAPSGSRPRGRRGARVLAHAEPSPGGHELELGRI